MKKIILIAIAFCILISANRLYAQASSEETSEKREYKVEDRREDLEARPQTAEEIMKILIERAKAKLADKRKELLWKFKFNAEIKSGFETNPLNDQNNKGDTYHDENFSANWVPTFNEHLSADVGYRFENWSYAEQTDLNTQDHTLNAILKYSPFESGKLSLEPGFEWESLRYPLDELASYDDSRLFLKFKNYAGKKWNWGGKYEYSYKLYDKKLARGENKANHEGISRADHRNTAELYITRYIGEFTTKVKVKGYRNNSNDEYQQYYDYDALKFYLTISRSFLKDDKLYVSFAPDFEKKSYRRRIAVTEARQDRVTQWKLNAYYTLKKDWSLNYAFTNKYSNSNAEAGEFVNITNELGVSVSF